ncbi:hypothetical protein HDU85_004305 [Gaertneriomyces sp. JEL0708]|nr:hypothetical protein HDU85_004305 [Gaertneriomyces sp. JEL0708]
MYAPDPYASGYPQQGLGDQKNTLWMGDLEPWMDENYVRQLWMSLGENVNVKMIRDRLTGQNAGYCFVDFMSHGAAMKHLTTINGTVIPGTQRVFKLNWASGGGAQRGVDIGGPEFSIFVGDLGGEVTDFMLLQTFQARYISCKSAKVVTDPATGMSRGYGFVRFSDETEQQRAMTEMQGQYCGSRAMRISMATPKNKPGAGSTGVATGANQYGYGAPQQTTPTTPGGYNQFNDPHNTTVFVGGLNGTISDDELRSYFAPFGDIVYTKIPPGKGCGFVQFVHRASAEMAIQQMNGFMIGGSRVRLAWGRSQAMANPNMAPVTPTAAMYPAAAPPAAFYPGYPPPMVVGGYGPPPMAPMPVHAGPQPVEWKPQTVEQLNEEYVDGVTEREEEGGWRPAVYVQ